MMSGFPPNQNVFIDLFSSLNNTLLAQINIDEIWKQWQALLPDYDVEHWQLPLPIWTKRAYEYLGLQAWEEAKLAAESSSKSPICIYIHIPFCTSKCGFCDSYSFKLGANTSKHLTTYVNSLVQELELWGQIEPLTSRPVSTVHLGGGTPTFLHENLLARLISTVRSNFATSDSTEWALESTVESLTPKMSDALHGLGFRRLHIGVQSLQYEVRKAIGRRNTPAEVLHTIEKHLEMGWIVSVDLICGLPGQTLEGWLKDIITLISVGTDGFSLYELLIYPQNRIWAKRYGLLERKHLPNYFCFVAGANLLSYHGYQKNLFNHWANDRDKNIYFTYPARGEDLIAIGTIANGVIGDYHYRHGRYASYISGMSQVGCGLEGGLRENALERAATPFNTAIMANFLPRQCIDKLASFPNGVDLISRWIEQYLVMEHKTGLSLTPSGSWFAGNMVDDIFCLLRDELER